MTTTHSGKTVTVSATYITAGYGISANYTSFTLASTGTIGGLGLHATQVETVANNGTIKATGKNDGINLNEGGSVANNGFAAGYNVGVRIGAVAGTVDNSGTIASTGGADKGSGYGVYLTHGGAITNSGTILGGLGGYGGAIVAKNGAASIMNVGSVFAQNAIILNGGGDITNDGTIDGINLAIVAGSTDIVNYGFISSEQNAIYLLSGGMVTNRGSIEAGYGVAIDGTNLDIVNSGLIQSIGATALYGAKLSVDNMGTISTIGAVAVQGTGQVTNGSSRDTSALISGSDGGVSGSLSGTLALSNFGTIEATGGNTPSEHGFAGVELASGSVINGSKTDQTALIEGYYFGINGSFAGLSISNFGTIQSQSTLSTDGIYLEGATGNSVTNGGLGDTVARIEGYYAGVKLLGAGSVANFGTISGIGDFGIVLAVGGQVTNGAASIAAATIYGYFDGVRATAGATVANLGTIRGNTSGVVFEAGGTLRNGFGGTTAALIQSGQSAVQFIGTGTVANYGTIASAVAYGINLGDGGTVTNGSAVSIGATIDAYGIGVFAARAAASLTNFGTIRAQGDSVVSYGVHFGAGGGITNGSGTDEKALIVGYKAAISVTGTAKIVNFGTLDGAGGAGVRLQTGGSVTNGSVTDVAATIIGYAAAIKASGAATVTNFGTLQGKGIYGVVLSNGGHIINGAPTSLSAVIESSYDGILGAHGGGTVSIGNFGSIIGHMGVGVYLADGGSLTNGAIQDGTALVQGSVGVEFGGAAGTVANFGTIDAADDDLAVSGIFLGDGGQITNGISGKSMGLVEGALGVFLKAGGNIVNYGTIAGDTGAAVSVFGAGTVANFGTIGGVSGTAVSFGSAADLLIAAAGSVFEGTVDGDGGTLEVLGTGTLSGLLEAANLTVSGSLPIPTAFTGFGTVDVGAGGDFAVAGNSTIAAGETLVVAGTLSATGTIVIAGSLSIIGSLSGAGTLAMTGGTVSLVNSQTYAGGFLESAGTLALGGKSLTLSGAAGFTGGTINGTGDLDTTGVTSVSALSFAGGAGWLNYGTATASGALTLGGTGSGGSRLSNDSGAIFDITANTGIAIASGGSGNIVNGGVIEKTAGTGTSTIAAAIANNGGTITVTSGTLDLAGAVSYTGQATIGSAGTLEFDNSVAASQTISFAGTTGGEVVLNDPSGTALSFAGTVAGFGGSDTLDLASFAFVAGTKPGWTQNGTSGTLTVTEGGDTAKITLFGQYVAAGFSATKDAAGDTLITYTTQAQVATLVPPHH